MQELSSTAPDRSTFQYCAIAVPQYGPGTAEDRVKTPVKTPSLQEPGVIKHTHTHREDEEEEEEEDLFVFNDTIEGPRAPAVKPGRVTQA